MPLFTPLLSETFLNDNSLTYILLLELTNVTLSTFLMFSMTDFSTDPSKIPFLIFISLFLMLLIHKWWVNVSVHTYLILFLPKTHQNHNKRNCGQIGRTGEDTRARKFHKLENNGTRGNWFIKLSKPGSQLILGKTEDSPNLYLRILRKHRNWHHQNNPGTGDKEGERD